MEDRKKYQAPDRLIKFTKGEDYREVSAYDTDYLPSDEISIDETKDVEIKGR